MKLATSWSPCRPESFVPLLVLLSVTASAQVNIQPELPGKEIAFGANGDLLLEGHCFGAVTTPPTGAISVFNGQAVASDGNLYFRGGINQNSGFFPDAIVIRNDNTILASVTGVGDLYLRGSCVNAGGCRNTTWESVRWNDGGLVQYNNNCYNYGNDKITNTFAQPGRASGNMYSSLTVAEVRDGALSDGLRWVGWDFPGNTYDCGNGHLIFMAVWPNVDYHWWRLDQTKGVWSHKPGSTQAKNVDNSGNPIINPLTANRGGYIDNGGFYCACGGIANIR